jgi:hypothetical protein
MIFFAIWIKIRTGELKRRKYLRPGSPIFGVPCESRIGIETEFW